jgi:hypothetical protein
MRLGLFSLSVDAYSRIARPMLVSVSLVFQCQESSMSRNCPTFPKLLSLAISSLIGSEDHARKHARSLPVLLTLGLLSFFGADLAQAVCVLSAPVTWTNAASGMKTLTIQGDRIIGEGTVLAINNSGTINANLTGSPLITTLMTLSNLGGITNTGLLESAANSGVLQPLSQTINKSA